MAPPDESRESRGSRDLSRAGSADAILTIPTGPGHHYGSTPPLRCCCGREDCAFLQHSSNVLDSVEKDVHTAAKLGQALLARHEAYMADAERDRLDLTTRIEQLEMDKRQLQAENAKTVEENRALLDQLETLNNTVHSSDIKVQTLEATLLSSQQAVRRLEGAAARAEEMERHVALLEREQMQLQNSLINTESEARSAMSRCKTAERGISELQGQLERMEKETKDERERHVEAIGRMERQREMDKELNTAAGRLKGAAAAKSLDKGKGGSSVVSHFVRDLLQDNANLQLGIAELRELLANSNDEIQALRDEMMFHQPTAAEGPDSSTSTLRAELGPQQEHDQEAPETPRTRLSQEFHIHHHYHVAQKAEAKKPKKRRTGLSPGIFSPPSGSTTPTTPRRNAHGPWRLGSSPAAPALLSHPHRESTPLLSKPPSNRWSVFSEQPSEFAASSVPSSPQSTHRYSMFDRFPDSDLPSSPTTSVDPMSPTLRASHSKRPSELSHRSVSVPTKLTVAPPTPSTQGMSFHPQSSEPIREETWEHDDVGEEDYGNGDVTTTSADTVDSQSEDPAYFPRDEDVDVDVDVDLPRPRLQRVSSHESIMSLTGGLDIHTLQSRPSQMTLRPLGGADAVFTSVTASSTLSTVTAKRSSAALRDSLAGLRTPQGASTPSRALSPSSGSSRGENQNPGKLARWSIWRPWGAGNNMVSNHDQHHNSEQQLHPIETSTTPSPTPCKKPEKEAERALRHRASGINQPGSIPGLQEYLMAHQRRGAPSKVLPDLVDVDALRESLEG